ncbi:MFS transporter [Herbidospora mongoliensis]|uniref:MFS transporter n=1 Tax=Herbidospora mongoliensis TaxID=688067 RepID=UPI000834EAA8|nr:MFS transporter [Herbidospora mongoliensis]
MREPRRDIWVVIGALMLSLLLAALDQTIVSTALPTIVREFGGLDHLSWVVTAYLLASTVSTPLWGKLGDQYGRKPLFQAAIVIFLIGSALCGLAQDMTGLIAFRALQGLGGGGLIVLAMAIVGDVVPPRERGRYQGYFGGVFAVASVVGPLAGGLFVDHLSWRWVFYVNLPIGVAALIAVAVTLPAKPDRTRHVIDYLGAVLLTVAVGCLVLVTTWGGTVYAWTSPPVLVLALTAVVFAALFLAAESRAAEPILPLRLFRLPVVAVTSAMGFVVGFAMLGGLAYLPLFLQVVHGVSATLSGVYLLPMMAGLLATSITTGRLISRTGHYRRFPIAGMAIMTVAMLLLRTLDETTSMWLVGTYFFVLGFGIGLVMQVLVIAVQNVVDYKDLGVATSAATFFRSIGGSFGVSVFGSIFAGELASRGGNTAGPHAYAESISAIFTWAAPVAFAGFLLSLFLREVPLRTTTGATATEFTPHPDCADSSQAEIERALTLLMRRDPCARDLYADLARRAGYDFSAGTAWVLCRVAREGHVSRRTLAERAGVAVDRGTPYTQPLVDRGLIERSGDNLTITTTGRRAARRLVGIRRAALARHLDGWNPDSNPELTALLTRLAAETVGDDTGATIL